MQLPLRRVCALSLAAIFVAGIVAAQEPSQATKRKEATVEATARPQDEQAIKASSQAFAKAFESGDFKKVASLFTEEAEYLDEEGEPLRGKAALAKAYEGFFAKRKQVQAESKTDAIRFLGTDTAVEEGTFTVTADGGSPSVSRFSALHVRQEGKWLIALLKEWSDDTAKKPGLEELSWLIGTWESESEELSARTTYEWTANKAFLRAQYSITPKKAGEPAASGVQVIGVDPAVGGIRAWLFASDGGIGESNWIWEENRWMIESVGTLADGSSTTAVNFLSRSGDNAFTWRSVQRTLAGEAQDDIGPVTVKRVAASGEAPRRTGAASAQESKP